MEKKRLVVLVTDHPELRYLIKWTQLAMTGTANIKLRGALVGHLNLWVGFQLCFSTCCAFLHPNEADVNV